MNPQDFLTLLDREYQISADATMESELLAELHFDSLDLYDLVLLCEELAGIDPEVVVTEFPLLLTVGDAYAFLQGLEDLVKSHATGLPDSQDRAQ